MEIKYLTTHTIQAVIEVVTGIHVGAGRDTVEIGGMDNPVIKNPHTQQPYIPGSSIKGKLRSLLEWALHKVQDDGMPYGTKKGFRPHPDDEILRIFGTTCDGWEGGPTRLIVRDAHLEEAWVEWVRSAGLPLTEDKTEVVIDRIQGRAAGNIGPRSMERVPAGARFRLEMLFREYETAGDGGRRDRQCLNRLLEALKLLEKDCLGGSGSRGYGQVRIRNLTVDGKSIQDKFYQITQFDLNQPSQLLA